MDKFVLSEKLTHRIGGREVKACVFTSYCFEPNFFEVDVIPYLLKRSIAYSSDERIKKYQVAEALRVAGLDIEVFFDQPMFESAKTSPSMQYLFHGVNLLPNIFHAKNIYLLVEDSHTQTRSLLVAAGSNNLTETGWWGNIETQHWEEVLQSQCDGGFVRQLLTDLEWLKSKRNLQANGNAIEQLVSFLNSCETKKPNSPILYYGITQKNYFEFIRKTLPGSLSNGWKLEIISPFFVNDSKSLLHEVFLGMGVQDITMLLPLDQNGEACCESQYYETIRKAERISWGKWNNAEAKALGVNKDLEQYRKLHAKVFHFFDDKESWLFVGSVNFTHKAIFDNVETGFFMKEPLSPPLLISITEDEDVICAPSLKDDELFTHDDESMIVDIFLSYDWKNRKLKGRTNKEASIEVSVIELGGAPILDSWHIDNLERSFEIDVPKFEAILKQTGFVNVLIKLSDKNDSPVEKTLLILQTGWSHKPVELPDLSPADILLIYAGMSEDRRQMMLMNARIKSFLRQNIGGELNSPDNELNDDGFFCEYAGIFYAFRRFRSRLKALVDDNNVEQLDYYLSGAGADSLPALIRKASEKSESSNDVASYLIMLSINEILSQNLYRGRLDVKEIKKSIRCSIKQLERVGGLVLEEGTNRKKFFAWLTTEFIRSYDAKEALLELSENG